MQKNKQVLDDELAQYRLYQLMSPSLPIGGFTYSQGLEWAVEADWVANEKALVSWLRVIVEQSIATLELPILRRYCQAVEQQDFAAIATWSEYLYACRETKELRTEEQQRGRALFTLLAQLSVPTMNTETQFSHNQNQLLGFVLAAKHWHISLEQLCQGYLWSWAENMVMAGVKLIPLGQTSGQKALMQLAEGFPIAIEKSAQVSDINIGSYMPALSIASSRHETQYTRLFRS
ncbi:urease accessory protein UreF [Photobacterium lucens]|uniref:urease accessory protein UreF n=1 Tax=Photobacterium lucens TaxID=2562949 RepID=UPI00136C16E8|nr:urease accessory protein UreF [Photobacterium lucens]MBP2698959.1 urease accessory protein UreF [Vibrio parahaemolyticus]MZG55923.1 urease accessory protein UreF [Photobacterium lucens]MZG80389.1 urease accessory protein UreF [Photobacterium lucens]